MKSSYQTLLLAIDGPCAWITLNRPERRNALSDVMYEELCEVVERLELDDTVRAVAITGTGPVFCAGGDIKAMQDRLDVPSTHSGREWRYTSRTTRVVQSLFSFRKPLVAVMNGPAIGGGACLALLADVRIACPEAWMSFPFLSRALLPDWGATYLLPRAFGPLLALDLMVSQRRVEVEQARHLGVLADVVPHAQLRARAVQMLEAIASAAPQPLRALKQQLRAPEVGALVQSMLGEGMHQAALTGAPAFAQAVGRFTGKAASQKATP